MKVIDLYGKEIDVTDLEKAIEQTDWFKDAHHEPPIESDKERQAYWRDMHEKLIKLKEQQYGSKGN